MAARACILLSLVAAQIVRAHEHHDELAADEQSKPTDWILWIHIFLQAAVWGILFPVGMVLGITRSRFHVPLQSLGFLLTTGGFILGHSHGGRMFLPSAHGVFANILLVPIVSQLVLGIYLKLHIHEQSIRPYAVVAHGIVGKAYPILGWTQMLFGAIAYRGYCRGEELGQCLAHYIMGSGFIAYAVIMALILLVGEGWVRRSGKSPEWWDSWVIFLWGIVNTFTEHRGKTWSVKDMQHSMLGVLWVAGGLLGIFLARNNKRNVVPAIILILTGWAMSEHEQHLMISTKVHAMFGYALELAGVTRIIEVVWFPGTTRAEVVYDDNVSDHTLAEPSPRFPSGSRYATVDDTKAAASRTFRHLPPFLLVCAGVLFMSGTDEELKFVHASDMDHVTYILIMFSIAFVLYTLIVFLTGLYPTTGRNAPSNETRDNNIELTTPRTKWYSRVPATPSAQTREAERPLHVVGEDDEED